MKKVITIIILFCFVLCACSKANSAPVATPSSTNTPTPTEKAEISLTETPAPTSDKFNTTCSVCGRISDCKEYIAHRYDANLKDYYDKAYYLCDTCYPKVIQNETECEYLDDLLMAANIALIDDELVEETKKQGPGYIILNSDGISFENVSEKMINKITASIPNYKEMTSSKEGKIEFCIETFDNLNLPAVIKKIEIPNIIDNLGK